jgi:glycopeptide antibiotics resistance protein
MLLLHLTAKYSWSKLVVMGLLAEYIYVIISITILHRGGVPEREASLIPFAFLAEVRVEPYLISEKLNNILLFIPLGVLLRMFKYKEQRLSCTRILLLGLTFSLSIETIQFITKRGVLETDDVFCNSIGCWIGGGIFYIFSIFVKKTRK